MRIAAWKVRRIYKEEEIENLKIVMERYNFDILAL